MGAAAPDGHTPPLVLVVDDEDALRAYMARVLTAAGNRVIVAHDGLEALGIAEVWSDALRLVVTDVNMPSVSGIELATRLRARWPSLPVLYVSGRDIPGDAPAAAFLHKPFTPAALADRAAALLSGLAQATEH